MRCCNDCYYAHIRRSAPKGPEIRDDSISQASGALLVASRALVGVAARSLAEIERVVTLPQYRALVLLASRGDQNVSTLAESLGIEPSTATRLCDRLEGKRLIERSTSTESRREVSLSLTAGGDKLLKAVARSQLREIDAIVGRLDPRSRRALTSALEAFAEVAGEMRDDAWKLGWTA
jgi:DNA-binding MarR family transcriptional regulator